MHFIKCFCIAFCFISIIFFTVQRWFVFFWIWIYMRIGFVVVIALFLILMMRCYSISIFLFNWENSFWFSHEVEAMFETEAFLVDASTFWMLCVDRFVKMCPRCALVSYSIFFFSLTMTFVLVNQSNILNLMYRKEIVRFFCLCFLVSFWLYFYFCKCFTFLLFISCKFTHLNSLTANIKYYYSNNNVCIFFRFFL